MLSNIKLRLKTVNQILFALVITLAYITYLVVK